MTNEEAIKIIQNEYKCVNRECDIEKSCGKCPYMIPTKEPILQAYEMAIQALSQEPTEKPMTVDEMEREYEKSKALFHKIVECDDAISREAVIDAIRFGISNIRAFNDTTMIRFYERENEALKKAIERVNKLSSVTQKSGKWVKIQSGDKDFPESIVCSKCGSENSHLDFNENAEPIGKVFVTSKYCPNCGAKMVKPQESEDK